MEDIDHERGAWSELTTLTSITKLKMLGGDGPWR